MCLLQVGIHPPCKLTLFPKGATRGKHEGALSKAEHIGPYQLSKAGMSSTKAAQQAAITSQSTTVFSCFRPRSDYPAFGPAPPFTPLVPSKKPTALTTKPPLLLGPAQTPSSALTCKRLSSAAGRSTSEDGPAQKAQYVPSVNKHKGSKAQHVTPTSDITTSAVCAKAALIPAWTPAMSLIPSHLPKKHATPDTGPLLLFVPFPSPIKAASPANGINCTAAAEAKSMPVSKSAAGSGPMFLGSTDEGQNVTEQGEQGRPTIGTPASSAAAGTSQTACFSAPNQVPAQTPVVFTIKNSSSSKSPQSPLQSPPCNPAAVQNPFCTPVAVQSPPCTPVAVQNPSCTYVGMLAASGTHNGSGQEPDKGHSTSSVAVLPATIHSSTTAAEETTVETSACLAGNQNSILVCWTTQTGSALSASQLPQRWVRQ